MKELLTKKFWRDVKQTFEEAREGPSSLPVSGANAQPLPEAALPMPATSLSAAGIVFDMDGVLYDADRAIAGAAETVEWVQSEAIPHLFVTNTTSRARADLVQKLASFGISTVESEILTPAAAAAEWLRMNDAAKIAAFVRPQALTELADLPLLADNAEDGAVYVVIGDLGDLWDYRTLNRAFRLLHHNPEAKLIALGMTRYWMASDGISLDVAPFVVALEHASGRRALVFGKPSAAFFRAAADRLQMEARQILMIGDDIEADVGGAHAAGFKTALVRTGKFQPTDLDRGIRPDFLFDSVADLPRRWKDESPSNRAAKS